MDKNEAERLTTTTRKAPVDWMQVQAVEWNQTANQYERQCSYKRRGHVAGIFLDTPLDEKHPSTQLWQVWISQNSTVIQVVSAHRKREAAEATLAEIKRVAMLGDLIDEEEVVSILDRLYKAGDGEPLASGTIRTICRNIEDAVWKREQEQQQ